MMTSRDRCVLMVATSDYLPRAFAGVASFLRHNLDCDAIILVADLSGKAVRSVTWPFPESVRLFGVDDIADVRFDLMHGYFNVLEFCCAAKVFLVHYAIAELQYRKAVLLDPDTLCFASFDDVWESLERCRVTLTPHVNAPMPDDGCLPDDRELMMAGFANAGFWAVRQGPGIDVVLHWLESKLVRYGFFAPGYGLYADQAWLSCLPWYFPGDVLVLRHPGLNVAYWNLHERVLSKMGAEYFSNDRPLMMLHLSGYDEKNPGRLTKYPSRPISEENARILGDILLAYSATLKEWAEKIPHVLPDRPCCEVPLGYRLNRYRDIHGEVPSFLQGELHRGIWSGLCHFVWSRLRRWIGAVRI